MSEPEENLFSSSPVSEEGFNIGGGSAAPEHTSLNKMTSPYYSYHVDKTIQKVNQFWGGAD